MRVGILVPTLAARDAVGTDTLEMARVLRAAGHEVRIAAMQVIGVQEPVLHPRKLKHFLRKREDVFLYHFSFGWKLGLELLRSTRARRVVRYHNITPAHFFHGISPEHEDACGRGREQIGDIAGAGADLYLAASHYNLQELISRGIKPATGAVLAPFNRLQDLLAAEADLPMLDRFRDDASTLLMVGRMAPNKGYMALIDAFAYYRRAYDADARLLLIGGRDPRLESFHRTLHARIRQHGVQDHVHFLSNLSEAELKAAFLLSDALVMLSEHEGFCVPLVEAMALGVPIVARGSSAIPETVGDGGLVWDDTEDAPLIAASIDRLRRDGDARRTLCRRARLRYERQFRPEVLAKQLIEHLERLR